MGSLATALEIALAAEASISTVTAVAAISTVTIAATSAAAFTVAIAAATTSAATEVTTWTIFLGTGFAHRDGSAIKGLAIQGFNRLLAFFGSAHGHKPKPTGALGHAVEYQVRIRDGSNRREQLLKGLFCGLEGEITYIEFHMMITSCRRLMRLWVGAN